jgi:3-hydroxybutyryl-CoA dehydrogenase
MPTAPHAADPLVAIVGAGVMGRGVARVLAQAGVRVLLHDAREAAATAALVELAQAWDASVSKGSRTATQASDSVARITVASALSDLQHADVVIEAIVEDLAAKQALFGALEEVVPAACVLATNTSSLSVTAIAAACETPERVVGLHFFNPVHAMKLVEVIDGARSAHAAGDAMMSLVSRIGHTPVRVRDTPGFLVNHAGRGYGTEALRMLSERVAAAHVIDAILREQAGFRLGPFELVDLVGLDVSVPVMESVYRQFWDEPRFRASPLIVQRRTAGLLGARSGEGFYQYVDGKRVAPAVTPPGKVTVGPVWVSDAHPMFAASARELLLSLGASLENGVTPSASATCIVTPLGDDVSACCARDGLDATRTVALDMAFSNAAHRTLMMSPVTRPDVRAQMEWLLSSDGRAVSTIEDSAGLVAQRTVSLIVNIACDIAQQGIATPADIDLAVTLGLGYPQGPLAWGDALGAATVLRILTRMHELSGDPRYRVSPWLRRRAELGVSLLTA